MYLFEIQDVIFAVTSLKYSTKNLIFSQSHTRSSTSNKLKHPMHTNSNNRHSYFHPLPHLWKAFFSLASVRFGPVSFHGHNYLFVCGNNS